MMKKWLAVLMALSLLVLCACGRVEEEAAPVEAEMTAEEAAADSLDENPPEEEPAEFDVYALEMQETPDSSCFSEVGYDATWQVLAVRFRDSGELYVYYDFPEASWQQFIGASSLGSHYNSNIKGQYTGERIE